MQVRERAQESLTAYQLQEEILITLRSGHRLRGFPGDWVISKGEQILDVLPQVQFESLYERTDADGLHLTGPDQSSLEKALGFGSTRDSKTLTLAVQRLARLKIGDVEKNFSVSQWEEIARRAEKRRLSVSAYVDQMVEKLLQDLWTSAI